MADRNFFACMVLLVGCCLLVAGCSNSSDFSGQAPQISDSDAVIVFQVFDPAHDNVTFMHRQHAETWNQACFVCHSHFNVRNDGAWKCGECHSNNDTEGLCVDDANNHDCMTVQCKICHQDLAMVPGGDPAPNCVDCHKPLALGVFADSPVQGLTFQTATHGGTTDASGSFTYLAGETISFSVGNIVLGSAQAKPFMTPLDLVAGVTGVDDPVVTNISVFLQTLDTDDNPGNGTTLPPDINSVAPGFMIDFTLAEAFFLADPNVLGLFSNYLKTPVSTASARAHLQNTIDTQFPPATGTRIGGAPNTHFILQGLYVATGGVNYTYQWYAADDGTGTNQAVIAGATAATYQPTVSEVGKHLMFEVTPDTGGSASQSGWLGPITDTKTVTLISTIDSPSQVEQFYFRLGAASTDAVFDVMSYEPAPGGGTTVAPDIFANGDNNDYLVCNIYLFQADTTLVFERSGASPYYEWTSKWNGRAKKNPIVNLTGLAAGDYIFALGVNMLSEVDAWGGLNTDGASWYFTRAGITNQNHYQLIITFTY